MCHLSMLLCELLSSLNVALDSSLIIKHQDILSYFTFDVAVQVDKELEGEVIPLHD